MSVSLGYQSLNVKPIGQTVTVPDNSLARLMYYLDCVFTVIQYDQSSRLTDYQNYYLLSKEEEQTVLGLVALFNPKVMSDLSLFIVSRNLVPYGSSNEFYQITDDRIGVHVNSEVVIGGRVVKVLKIMACTEDWIYRNYINPAESYTKPQLTSGSNYNYSSNYNSTNNNNNTSCRKTCIGLIVIIIIIVIICTNV
jgi:hypothetical protein